MHTQENTRGRRGDRACLQTLQGPHGSDRLWATILLTCKPSLFLMRRDVQMVHCAGYVKGREVQLDSLGAGSLVHHCTLKDFPRGVYSSQPQLNKKTTWLAKDTENLLVFWYKSAPMCLLLVISATYHISITPKVRPLRPLPNPVSLAFYRIHVSWIPA